MKKNTIAVLTLGLLAVAGSAFADMSSLQESREQIIAIVQAISSRYPSSLKISRVDLEEGIVELRNADNTCSAIAVAITVIPDGSEIPHYRVELPRISVSCHPNP